MATTKLTGLVLPETVEERERSDDGRRAEFLLQPLERGLGHTLGNSIRRILLSSLPGAAVWAFRADGVQHEHQAIEDVVEDVHQVVQNLKGLVLILEPERDEARLEVSVSESGTVTGADITDSAAVEVVNPDQVLFTLQEDQPENRPLRVDLWVRRGRGFVQASDHEISDDMPVDTIRVDSVFNPVTRANFSVHETRVGQRTDYDRLTVEIETNGALDPADAVGHAAEIAQAHLQYLAGFGETVAQPGGEEEEDEVGPEARPGLDQVDDEIQELLEAPLEAFDDISVRSRNTLEKADIQTLADVVGRSRDEMLKVDNFGEKSLEEVAEVLGEHGLRFGMSLERDGEGSLYVRDESEADEETEEAGDAA